MPVEIKSNPALYGHVSGTDPTNKWYWNYSFWTAENATLSVWMKYTMTMYCMFNARINLEEG